MGNLLVEQRSRQRGERAAAEERVGLGVLGEVESDVLHSSIMS
jgi:hypothetical protein